MPEQIFTTADQLQVTETLIEGLRWARAAEPEPPERRIWLVLKSIAASLRGRAPDANQKTLRALSYHVRVALRGKARIGYLELGHMQALSENVIAHWPVIEAALKAKTGN